MRKMLFYGSLAFGATQIRYLIAKHGQIWQNPFCMLMRGGRVWGLLIYPVILRSVAPNRSIQTSATCPNGSCDIASQSAG
jgi:hypothetical protein